MMKPARTISFEALEASYREVRAETKMDHY